jgi:hypothetical protein
MRNMINSNQYSEKYRRLYSAITQGDFAGAKSMIDSKEQSFVQFMDEYIAQHGLVRQTILLRADIPVAVGYKYLNGTKRTKNRNTILRLCIAMNMHINDVQKVLSLYGMSALNDSGRDSVIIMGIVHRSDVDTIDDWLRAMAFEPIMENYDR